MGHQEHSVDQVDPSGVKMTFLPGISLVLPFLMLEKLINYTELSYVKSMAGKTYWTNLKDILIWINLHNFFLMYKTRG